MSSNPKHQTTSQVNNRVGPDFFGFYTAEVIELLCKDKDESLSPVPHPILHIDNEAHEEKRSTKNRKSKENIGVISFDTLFGNGVGALFSELKRERLKSLLRQSVFTLTKEVDELVDPILSICRIHLCLKCKEPLACKVDMQQPHKRLKHECLNGSFVNTDTKDKQECSEIDDDMRFLLESDTTKVEELVKKQTDEFSITLHHMEEKLEELLNTLMTSCRPMTLAEKQQIRRSIQNLSPENLDRVVEIIEQKKLPSRCDEVCVELDGMDNVTLWRLHFYVATIQASTK